MFLWVLSGVFLGLAGLGAFSPWWFASLVPGLVFLWTAVIVNWTKRRFSSRGGAYQDRIHDLILRHKTGPGDSLDIGCGSGHLVIAAAKVDRSSRHVGLDDWGDGWAYSEALCEANARREGVDNVRFLRGSAEATGIEGGRCAYVFSCLTFHEVRGLADKTRAVREALRTLAPGGTYVFLDLFDDARFYPEPGALAEAVRQSGCSIETNARLSDLVELPFPLNGRRALRYARLVSGRKGAA